MCKQLAIIQQPGKILLGFVKGTSVMLIADWPISDIILYGHIENTLCLYTILQYDARYKITSEPFLWSLRIYAACIYY